MVRKYRVCFFKRLADSTGHAVDACQATLEVHALNKQLAIEAARLRFAETARIGKWWLRADYTTIEPAGAEPAGATAGRASRKPPPHRTAR